MGLTTPCESGTERIRPQPPTDHEIVTDHTQDDVEPDADVTVPGAREVWVVDSRFRTVYHLYPDCRQLESTSALEKSIASDAAAELSLCTDCSQREQVRAKLTDTVPTDPNPENPGSQGTRTAVDETDR